jgi:hypothetical protein
LFVLSVVAGACDGTAVDADAGTPDAALPPDATPPPDASDQPCDPYLQDCPSGSKCSIVPVPEDSSVFRCVDDAGSQEIGQQCEPATATTPDLCRAGLVCRGDADPRCVEFCERDPADTCSAGHVCAMDIDLDGDLIPDAHVCAPLCDPLAQDCVASDHACYPSRLGAVCATEGAGGTPAGVGEPCAYANSCAAGLGCFGSGQDYRCYVLCDYYDTGGPTCAAGELCYRVSNENFGVCAP